MELWNEWEDESKSSRFNDFVSNAVEITKAAMGRIDETGEELEGWQLFFPDMLEALYGIDGCIPRGGDLEQFSHLLYHLAKLVPQEAREKIKASYIPDETRGQLLDEETGAHYESLEQWCNWQGANPGPHPIPDAVTFEAEIRRASRDLHLEPREA
jgi:hypothetical protein